MGITIGIDIGGTTTKIVGIGPEKNIITPMMVRANDPAASLFGAFGKFIDENSLSISDVDRVALTGVGASSVSKKIYGIPTYRVEEFLSNGLGGLFLSGLEDAIIVSMGTGTSFVRALGDGTVTHIGGTGVGGGTIRGLADQLLKIRDFDVLVETAKDGDLSKVDLTVGDISRGKIPELSPNATASNFGKLSDRAEKQDIARAIFNLVFQTIGMLSVFAARGFGSAEVVLIGNLTSIPYCHEILGGVGQKVRGFGFIIPEHSEHGTAVGAALAVINGRSSVEL